VRRAIGASFGTRDLADHLAAQAFRPKSLPVVCLQALASEQYPPLKIGNIVGTSVIRLVGALLLEQNDEWATTRRYMTLETLGTVSDTAVVSLPAMAV